MHNNTPIVPYISLCSGYEGIGLGLHRCIPNLRCIAYCEREAFAVANLVAKMENGLLDAAPVFTDVTTFFWEQFAPYMAGGILSFGWPCQPVSCAGKRKATEDERWLFDIIADGIALMRPGILFAENVEGLLSAKMPDGSLVFAHCIERLESLHYKVAAGIFSASEVGAPHQRKRVFILAVSNSLGGAAGLSRSLAWDEGIAGVADHGRHMQQGRWSESVGSQYSNTANASQNMGYSINAGVEGTHDNGTAPRWIQPYAIKSSHRTVWPSRPGEQQHEWEPPRVVANSERGRGEEPEHQHTNLPPEPSGGNAETMGNAASKRPHRGAQDRLGLQSEVFGERHEAMGNTASDGRQHDQQSKNGREARTTAESSKDLGNADYGRLASGINAGSGTEADRGGQGDFEQAEPWQVERTMGLHSHGTSDGLGHAELSGICDSELAEIREWMVKCDNRTDELRLLGNGVVPATATRAFLTLLQELTK